MPNEPATNEAPTTRDRLATTRTQLANERTLLAYLRTAIMLAATGATALKLFPGEGVMIALGVGLIASAAGVGAIGGYRFRKVARGLE